VVSDHIGFRVVSQAAPYSLQLPSTPNYVEGHSVSEDINEQEHSRPQPPCWGIACITPQGWTAPNHINQRPTLPYNSASRSMGKYHGHTFQGAFEVKVIDKEGGRKDRKDRKEVLGSDCPGYVEYE
jgi:hypothetical protein